MDTEQELTKTFWVENLCNTASRFARNGEGFRLEPRGYVGSIMEIDRRLANDPFVRRAAARNRIRMLAEDEALDRMDKLEIPEDAGNGADPLQQALSLGASEKTGRYSREDLPDDAEPSRPQTVTEIWKDRNTGEAAPRQARAKTVTRSADASDVPAIPVVDYVLPPEQVMTEPVKEGEWESQTG